MRVNIQKPVFNFLGQGIPNFKAAVIRRMKHRERKGHEPQLQRGDVPEPLRCFVNSINSLRGMLEYKYDAARMVTTCLLILPVNTCGPDFDAFVGVARLHPDDTYNEERGRKLAFNRAVCQWMRDMSIPINGQHSSKE